MRACSNTAFSLVLKVFNISEDGLTFMEACNLRPGGRTVNLNSASNDVSWNRFNPDLISTAATNGAVVIWNLRR